MLNECDRLSLNVAYKKLYYSSLLNCSYCYETEQKNSERTDILIIVSQWTKARIP